MEPQIAFGNKKRPDIPKLSSILSEMNNGHEHQQHIYPFLRPNKPVNSSSSGSLIAENVVVNTNMVRRGSLNPKEAFNKTFEEYVNSLVEQKIQTHLEQITRAVKFSILGQIDKPEDIPSKSPKKPSDIEPFNMSNNSVKSNVYQPPAKRGVVDWQQKMRNTPIKISNNVSFADEQVVSSNSVSSFADDDTIVPSPLSIEVKHYSRELFDEIFGKHDTKDWDKYAIRKSKYFDKLFDRLILQDIVEVDKYTVESTMTRNE